MKELFVLDEGCDAVLVECVSIAARWTEFPHARQRERGLVMVAGERLKLPALRVPAEPVLWMRCMRGLAQISDDGLDVEIWVTTGKSADQLLLCQRLENDQVDAGLREIVIDLPLPAGSDVQLEIRCGAGPKGDPRADWLGLVGLVVCARGELALNRARSHQAWRLKNEIEHFSQVYSGEFYRDRQLDRGASAAAIGPLRNLPARTSPDVSNAQMRSALRARLASVEPAPGEQAFAYAHRMLERLIPLRAPDFAGRLRDMSIKRSGRPLRMLALCAGEASVEGGLLAAAAVPVELCIVDVNAGLLEQAAMRMPKGVTVDRVLGDANDIGPQLGQFDIVNITSGLHHLVELERVLGAIAELLLPGGEFWLIGEQVGRNGNQLWPEAISVADRVFTSWPPSKRTNRNTGKLDASLPNADFSAGCFEGIRSQDIIDQLGRYFLPINCYLRNAFLWRLVDVAYSANFDPTLAADRDLLMNAVVEESMHWAHGGRGTEMHAVYRSKLADTVELAAS
ncbi:MAG: class I SAM-dependent methyltransferase [Rhodanobacter sp.]